MEKIHGVLVTCRGLKCVCKEALDKSSGTHAQRREPSLVMQFQLRGLSREDFELAEGRRDVNNNLFTE